MAMFSTGTTAERPAKSRNPAEHGLSILAAGIHITGELKADGVVKIEGTVEGTVRADGQVLVAKGGVVIGDIYTREAVIGGEVRGAVYAEDRLEAQMTSVINGDINTPKILVHDGGQLNGRINMTKAVAKQKSGPSKEEERKPSRPANAPFEVLSEPKPAAKLAVSSGNR